MALPLSRRLIERFGALSAWIRSSAFRKFFAATVAVAVTLAMILSIVGYAIARRVIQESVLSDLRARTELAALQVELTVGGVMTGARALARNGIITNALVDSQGREQFVEPLLRGFAAESPAPVRLEVVDFRGRAIANNLTEGQAAPVAGLWLAAVLERGVTRVTAEQGDGGPVILFAQPIIFPGTDRPEGGLIAEIPLLPIIKDFAERRPDQIFDLLDSDAPATPTGEATFDAAYLTVERRLALGDGGGLRLRVGIPHGIAFSGLHRFAAITAAGVAGMFVVVLLVVWLLASRLTAGVSRLSASVVDAALTERLGFRVPSTGQDEVGALGAAFNVLLARLEQASEARLAEQVERRQGAERALHLARAAVEQAVEAIEVVTADGAVAFANGAAARLRELPREEVAGARWERLFDRTPDWWSGLWGRLRTERALEIPLRIRRGNETIAVSASLVYFELDGVEHCIATVRDVRERLRAEATERLASLGTLAAGVAHEINNPLAYVLGNLAYVKESLESPALAAESEEERRALSEAIHGAERVRDVVRSLRAYSRAGQGPAARVDVAAELRGALKLVGSTVRHRARVVEEIGATPAVLARTNELGQVFVNLLVNASQAVRPEAGVDAEIRVRCSTAPDGRARVEVADNGVGIPPEAQPRIFEPFFTTKAVGDGTGLGLSICHGIVTQLGGSISFESEPGVGTRFTVLLPATASGTAAEAADEVEPPRGRILVVDDDPAVTRALARVLGRTAEVAVETSPEAALGRLATGPPPDVVLCDVMMPGLSGPEFHARLLATDPALARRVVFITGGAVSEAIANAVAATGQPCVEKPPERAALARAIASVRGTGLLEE